MLHTDSGARVRSEITHRRILKLLDVINHHNNTMCTRKVKVILTKVTATDGFKPLFVLCTWAMVCVSALKLHNA